MTEPQEKPHFNVQMQIPGMYLLAIILFAGALVSWGMFAVNLSHMGDSEPNTQSASTLPIMIIALCAAAVFLFLGVWILYNLHKNTSDSKIQRISQQNVRITINWTRVIELKVKNFIFSFQLPVSVSFWGIFVRDASVGGITVVGWTFLALGFVVLPLFFYGVYSAISNSKDQNVR